MKPALMFLAGFCLVVGSILSMNATSESMAWFMFTWAVSSLVIFGALALVFPER